MGDPPLDHVEVDLDDASPPPSAPSGWSRALVALALVIVVGTLVAGLVMRAGGDGGDDEDVADVTTTGPDVTGSRSRPSPSSSPRCRPGRSTARRRGSSPCWPSPSPTSIDGQVVTVLGRGFVPGEQVGVVMCTSDAGVQGVAACDLGVEGGFEHVTYARG